MAISRIHTDKSSGDKTVAEEKTPPLPQEIQASSEESFRQILDAIGDMILVKGPQSRLLWANKAFLEYYGMTDSQLRGIIDAPFSEPSHTEKYIKDDAYVFTTRTSLEIPEEKVTRHNKTTRLFHTVKSPIFDTDGNVIFTVGISKDITEKKEKEEQLRRNQEFLSSILNNTEAVITVKDTHGKILLANRKFENLCHQPVTEIIGKTLYDLFPKNFSKYHLEKDLEVIQNEKPLQFEIELESEHEIRSYLVAKFPLYDTHLKIYAVCSISTDITERVKVQRALEEERARALFSAKMATLGEMAGGIAHEINNPLSAIHIISGQIQDILNDETPNLEYVKNSAKIIEQTTLRIAKIVAGLLTFSRDGSKDRHSLHLVEQIIEETLAFSREKLLNHGIQLKVQHQTPSLSLNCSSTQLSQVVLNLMNNAYDAVATHEQKWIRLETRQINNQVEISITDSGNGISKEVIHRIFSPFFTTKALSKGTGLGLSISRGIVEAHRGTLTVDHACPHTRFVIRIPIA